MTELFVYSALFASSFLAATLLPGGSEAVLAGVLTGHDERLWLALGVATLGNTFGGLTSYALGRLLPAGQLSAAAADPDEESAADRRLRRALHWIRKYGAIALLLAWAPLIGDALCVAAGWLRIRIAGVLLFMAVGKFLRYALVAAAVLRLG